MLNKTQNKDFNPGAPRTVHSTAQCTGDKDAWDMTSLIWTQGNSYSTNIVSSKIAAYMSANNVTLAMSPDLPSDANSQMGYDKMTGDWDIGRYNNNHAEVRRFNKGWALKIPPRAGRGFYSKHRCGFRGDVHLSYWYQPKEKSTPCAGLGDE